MKIDYDRIQKAFPGKAWAYAEQIDSVKIGKWLINGFLFCDPYCKPLDEDFLLELRIFDGSHELKFSGGKCRDTADYEGNIDELAEAGYFMYGEHAEAIGEYTRLWEDRGGIIYFPAKLVFPGITALKLGIRNYVRYNEVPILPQDIEYGYDYGLLKSGAGALDVYDYAYTGFYYTDGKAVGL